LQFPQIFVALDEPQAPQTFGSSAANFIATRSRVRRRRRLASPER
jgi:hypothetical protein